ncbi:hypothetical protein WJX81_006960 [Elliptochloris bilobata]|uniref:Large ribosomal subunit protein bL9c n=1 Tax=Elliptochloris bilobata TaxID=381761 RepID=A0AAW1RE62_9CHLO
MQRTLARGGGEAGCALRSFDGFRAAEGHRACTGHAAPARSRLPFVVEANKRVVKRQKVVLRKDVTGLGKSGELTKVPNGYYRNWLLPQGLAAPATQGILAGIEKDKQDVEKRERERKAKAKAMATALQTIGKFIVKKKVGEQDQIFGSVTTAEIVAAIAQQTGRELDKRDVELPEIKKVGTYDARVRLHPEVVGDFKVVVQREKNA